MTFKKSLSVLLILTLTGALAAGCQKFQPQQPETPGEAVTPVESTPPAEELPANPYSKIIEGYAAQIGYVTEETKETQSEAAQKALVEDMKALKKQGADSKTVFGHFAANIASLEAPYSDEYAAYAISALQHNGFNDYVQFEPFFNEKANYDGFFKALEPFERNYLSLKRASGQITEPSLKAMFDLAAEQGYLLVSAEGMIFPVVDFTEFAKYKALYSPEFGALIDQYAYSNAQILVSDGGLVTGLDEVAARVFEAERALMTAEDTKYQKYLVMVYIDHLRILLHGTDNSPAFDYETLKVRDEVSLLFKQLSAYENSKTATYIQMHMAALEASDGKYDEATYAKINALVEKIQADYKVTEADAASYQNWISGNLE